MIYAYEKSKKKSLSKHFNSMEFHCSCSSPLCNYTLVSPVLVEHLEQLRVACGNRPIKINSGYRCQSHNEDVGGVPKSKHTLGWAADIVVPKMHLDEIKYRAEQLGFAYCYVGEGFVHVSVNFF